jgi:hydroxymethylglutaryl-CoA lyase
LKSIERKPGTYYKATCANVKAVERALADLDAGFGANEISLLVSATESHTQKNLNRTRAGQWQNIAAMVAAAKGRFRMVGTVSVAFGCPFEGKVDAGSVAEDVSRFSELGVTHVALGDTTGMATPAAVQQLFSKTKKVTPIAHFHDTRGTGLVNYVAAYDAGVRHFDSSFGGVGGHPAKVKYGGGFTGNVCTEDLVNLLEAMGIDTGIDLDGLLAAAELCEQALGRELHGRVTRSGLHPLLSR